MKSPRRLVTLATLSLLGSLLGSLSTSLHAQPGAIPGPAPELAKLKPFAGKWRGEGTAVMRPGGPTSKWTASVDAQWQLGGHFLQSDTEIHFDGMPTPMRFREFMGWDRENRRYVNLVVSNTGEGMLTEPHFADDHNLVLMMRRVEGGMPLFERTVTTIDKDSWKFVITFLRPEGDATESVRGDFQRDDRVRVPELGQSEALMPADGRMAKLARMAGVFDVAGEMTMPGMQAMKITGKDTVRTLFGGSIVEIHTVGGSELAPDSYEAFAFYALDAGRDCYRMVYVNNMGQVGSMDARFVGDDKLVATFAGQYWGQPTTSRVVLKLDARGRPAATASHSCMGADEPTCDFRATYTPAK
ncbi:MAG: DUF1579 family protein [Planctomycetota bacterium]